MARWYMRRSGGMRDGLCTWRMRWSTAEGRAASGVVRRLEALLLAPCEGIACHLVESVARLAFREDKQRLARLVRVFPR